MDDENKIRHTGYRREYAERAGCLICVCGGVWCCPAAFEKTVAGLLRWGCGYVYVVRAAWCGRSS